MLFSSSDTRVTLMHQCLFTNTALRELVSENTQHQLSFLALLPWVALPFLSILVYLSKNVKLCKYYTLRIPGDLYLAVWKDLATNWNIRTYRGTQIFSTERSVNIYLYFAFFLFVSNKCQNDWTNRARGNELYHTVWTQQYDAFIPQKKTDKPSVQTVKA